jgi:hypothetical protein
MDERKTTFWERRLLRLGIGTALVLGAAAVAYASVPHTFRSGEALRSADLNDDFAALDNGVAALAQRVAALETREPAAGTYPAVIGLGGIGGGASNFAGAVFCGSAPDTLNLASLPSAAQPNVFSSAFGPLLFTNAGALNVLLGESSTSSCSDGKECAAPVTFFLRSPRAQAITLHVWVDDAGVIYVDGAPQTAALAGSATATINVPQGAFALSFLSCSLNGPSLVLDIFDQFLANPDYGLTVDYDRVFHRGGH